MTPYLVLRIVVLGITACLSAFFSGSETALFSLPLDEVRRMSESKGLDKAIASLLSRPRRLLTTVLLGNTVVNVAFYSVSFLLILRYQERLGPTACGLLGIGSLLTVVIFGEILPKNLAVSFPRPFSRLAALPLIVMQKALGPGIAVLERATDMVTSAIGQRLKGEPPVRAEELQMLIGISEREGVLDRDIGGMIAEVMQLSGTAVREIMVPRVEIACFDVAEPLDALGELFRKEKHTLIPAYEGLVDNMLGVVHARDYLLRAPSAKVSDLVRPIPFLPETATVEDALKQFREQHTRMAFVVDEYGAVEGLVTVEDMLEEIVGEIEDVHEEQRPKPVERLDERRFRLSGNLSAREWHQMFEMSAPELSVDTVGGLVMALLDRVPRAGDHVRYEGLDLTVERMHGRRVISVILELSAEDSAGGGGPGHA